MSARAAAVGMRRSFPVGVSCRGPVHDPRWPAAVVLYSCGPLDACSRGALGASILQYRRGGTSGAARAAASRSPLVEGALLGTRRRGRPQRRSSLTPWRKGVGESAATKRMKTQAKKTALGMPGRQASYGARRRQAARELPALLGSQGGGSPERGRHTGIHNAVVCASILMGSTREAGGS